VMPSHHTLEERFLSLLGAAHDGPADGAAPPSGPETRA